MTATMTMTGLLVRGAVVVWSAEGRPECARVCGGRVRRMAPAMGMRYWQQQEACWQRLGAAEQQGRQPACFHHHLQHTCLPACLLPVQRWRRCRTPHQAGTAPAALAQEQAALAPGPASLAERAAWAGLASRRRLRLMLGTTQTMMSLQVREEEGGGLL